MKTTTFLAAVVAAPFALALPLPFVLADLKDVPVSAASIARSHTRPSDVNANLPGALPVATEPTDEQLATVQSLYPTYPKSLILHLQGGAKHHTATPSLPVSAQSGSAPGAMFVPLGSMEGKQRSGGSTIPCPYAKTQQAQNNVLPVVVVLAFFLVVAVVEMVRLAYASIFPSKRTIRTKKADAKTERGRFLSVPAVSEKDERQIN